MKKKMLGIIAFAAIAAVAGWNYNQNMNNVNLSDLALENVEALASGEGGNGWWCCGTSGYCSVDFSTGGVTVGDFRVTPC
jgi:hypothetical protein